MMALRFRLAFAAPLALGLAALGGCQASPPSSGPAPLVGPLSSIAGLTAAGGYAYFVQSDASSTTHSIARVPETGGATETVVVGVPWPQGLAVDATRVYWTAGDSLFAAPLSGLADGAAPTTVATGLTTPAQVVVTGGSAYVAESTGLLETTLVAVALDGNARAPTTLAAPGDGILGAMVGDGTAVYFTLTKLSGCGVPGVPCASVERYAAGDAAPTTLFASQGLVEEIAVAGSRLYLATDAFTGPTPYQILSLPTDGSSTTPATLASEAAQVELLTATAGAVYWTVVREGLWSVSAAGGAPTQVNAQVLRALASDGQTVLGLGSGAQGDSLFVEGP